MLIISIICLIYFINTNKKEEYDGIFVKVGDDFGYICKAL